MNDPRQPRIWVDADSCPKVIKELLFKAAARRKVTVLLVANQPLATPQVSYVRAIQVGAGFDVADNYIAEQVTAGDLVVTADIPLAAQIIEKAALVITPRGERLSAGNIRQRLGLRNFLSEMRDAGVQTGGPASFSQQDKQAFANQLDQWLTKNISHRAG